MTDQLPAKKKRRRRNRRRGSGGQAGAAFTMTPENVAEYSKGLHEHYGKSVFPAVQVENRPGIHPDPYDKAAEAAGIAAEQKAHVERIHSADELVNLLIPLITQARHKVVFDWAAGGSPGAFVQRIVRAEIARLQPAYREAHGGGGKSSQNLEALEKRL